MRRVRALWCRVVCRIRGHRWYDNPAAPYPMPEGFRRSIVCLRCDRHVPWSESLSRQSSSSPWPLDDRTNLREVVLTAERSAGLPPGWGVVSVSDTSPSPRAKDTGSRFARNGASR